MERMLSFRGDGEERRVDDPGGGEAEYEKAWSDGSRRAWRMLDQCAEVLSPARRLSGGDRGSDVEVQGRWRRRCSMCSLRFWLTDRQGDSSRAERKA